MNADPRRDSNKSFEQVASLSSGCALALAACIGTPLVLAAVWLLNGLAIFSPVAWFLAPIATWTASAIFGVLWPRAVPLSGLVPLAAAFLVSLALSSWTWGDSLSSTPPLCVGLCPFAILGGFSGRRASGFRMDSSHTDSRPLRRYKLRKGISTTTPS